MNPNLKENLGKMGVTAVQERMGSLEKTDPKELRVKLDQEELRDLLDRPAHAGL